MAWALQKCDYYLRGMPSFSIFTDHWPLVGIFGKSLSDIVNPRIMRLQERMLPYNFEVSCMAGKLNVIANTFSHNPVVKEEPLPIQSYIIAPSKITEELKGVAKNCDEYRGIIEAWSCGTKVVDIPPSHPVRRRRR